LWSASHSIRYRKWTGMFRYFYDCLPYKILDLLGVLTYVLYVSTSQFGPMMCVGHSIQISQTYRLCRPQLRLTGEIFRRNFGFLFALFLCALFVFLLLSTSLYLVEKDHNSKIDNIYDATWLVYMTILSVG